MRTLILLIYNYSKKLLANKQQKIIQQKTDKQIFITQN